MSDEDREFVEEALANMLPNSTPLELTLWIGYRYKVWVSPEAVGKQLCKLGYRTEMMYKKPSVARIIKKNP